MPVPSRKRIVSGIQPSGVPHIGNVLGALNQWVDLQNAENTCFWFVADLHAITAPFDASQLRRNALVTAAALLALGIDPEKSVLFIQSQVPAHTEATWYLQSLARVGELSRMTQFKDKGGGKKSASAGLFAYPVLQAADILLYRPDVVPVGEDQVQHLELTRVLARRFHTAYGSLFTEPQPYVLPSVARIMSLTDPTKKMSKSGDRAGCIFLTDDNETIQQKVKVAVTDSGTAVDAGNLGPALTNLFTIYGGVAGRSVEDLAAEFDGKGYAAVKAALAETLIVALAPVREKIQTHLAAESDLRATLQLGARRASDVAGKTLHEMKERMGFLGEAAGSG